MPPKSSRIKTATLKTLLFRARRQVARRIRDRYVAPYEQSPRDAIHGVERNAALQFREKARSVGDVGQSRNGRRRIGAEANQKNRLAAANRGFARKEIF